MEGRQAGGQEGAREEWREGERIGMSHLIDNTTSASCLLDIPTLMVAWLPLRSHAAERRAAFIAVFDAGTGHPGGIARSRRRSPPLWICHCSSLWPRREIGSTSFIWAKSLGHEGNLFLEILSRARLPEWVPSETFPGAESQGRSSRACSGGWVRPISELRFWSSEALTQA